MRVGAKIVGAAVMCCSALLPIEGRAEGIDTEHLFGFMIGSDVGSLGEREFQSETTARFSKNGGTYRAITQEFELEFVPARNFRIEAGGAFASYDIAGVTGFADRSQFGLQGISLDLRYRFLDRDSAPFGLLIAADTHADRVDETTAAAVRNYGTDLTLAVDRELVPDRIIAALNLLYRPEWTSLVGGASTEREATIGAAAALMAQIQPGVLIGGETRYLRRYDDLGLNAFVGQALFVGPTVYIKLSEQSRLTLAWSFQAWGRSVGTAGSLNLVDFERHQARVVFGVNF